MKFECENQCLNINRFTRELSNSHKKAEANAGWDRREHWNRKISHVNHCSPQAHLLKERQGIGGERGGTKMHHWLNGKGERRVGCDKRIPPCQISLSVSLSSKHILCCHVCLATGSPLLCVCVYICVCVCVWVCVCRSERKQAEKAELPLPQSYMQPAFEEDPGGEQGGRRICNRVNLRPR